MNLDAITENQVRMLIIEMNSPHNDGWVRQGAKEKLEKLERMIRHALEKSNDI